MDKITDELLAKETLEAEQFEAIFEADDSRNTEPKADEPQTDPTGDNERKTDPTKPKPSSAEATQ